MSGAPHPAAIMVEGVPYLRDAKGALVPIAAIKAADLLMDEVVREIIGEAREHNASIRAFKGSTFERVGALQSLINDQYGAKLGGAKGNITMTTVDGCLRVQVQVADLLEFGPELQAAKVLIDECLAEWAQGGSAELIALVNRVFQVDGQGHINRSELFMLMRTESTDPRWVRAMDAIRDSIRVIGSRQYVRFYEREAPGAPAKAITIDLASA